MQPVNRSFIAGAGVSASANQHVRRSTNVITQGISFDAFMKEHQIRIDIAAEVEADRDNRVADAKIKSQQFLENINKRHRRCNRK